MHSGHISEYRLHFDVECGRNTTLHKAAASGELLEILQLPNLSARVKSTTRDGQTPLHQSADGGHTEVVKILLSRGASVNAQDNKKQTPLHWGVMGHSKDVVKALIKNGACVNAADVNGQTPLHVSAHEGLVGITECLLKYGGSLDSKDNEAQTPLHLAARQGHFKVTKLLLANGASANIKDKYGCTPEKLARCCGHVDLAGVIRKRRISRSSDDLDTVQERPIPGQTGEEPHNLYQSFVRSRMGHSRQTYMNTENSARMSLKEAASRLSSSTSSVFLSEFQSTESVVPELRTRGSGSITNMQDEPTHLDPAKANTFDASHSAKCEVVNDSQSKTSIINPSNSQTIRARETTSPACLQPSSSSVRRSQTCKTASKTKETGITSETEKMPSGGAETNKVQLHTDVKGKKSQNTSGMYNSSSGTSGMAETSTTTSGKGESSSMKLEKNKSSSSGRSTSEKNKVSPSTSKRGKTSSTSSSTPENNNITSGTSKGSETTFTALGGYKTRSKTSDKNETSSRSSSLGMSQTSFNTLTMDGTSCNTSEMKMSRTAETSAPSINISETDRMSFGQSERDKIPFPTSRRNNTSPETSEKKTKSTGLSKISDMTPNTSRRNKTSSNTTAGLENNSLDVQQDKALNNTPRTSNVLPNTSKVQEKISRTSQDSRCTLMPYPIQTSPLLSQKGDNSDTTCDEHKTLPIQDRVRRFEQLKSPKFQTVTSPDLSFKLRRNERVAPTTIKHDDSSADTATRMLKCTSQIQERKLSLLSESSTSSKLQNSPSSASESQKLPTVNTDISQKSRPGLSHAPTFATAQPTTHIPSPSPKPNKKTAAPNLLNRNKNRASSSAQCGRLNTPKPPASNTADLKQTFPKSKTGGAGQSIDSMPVIRTVSKISPFRPNEELNGISGNVRDRIRFFQPPHKNSTTEPSSFVKKLPLNTSASRTPTETTPRQQMSTHTVQHNYLREALAPLEEIVTALNQQENGRNNVILVQVSPTFHGPQTYNVENADNVVHKGTIKIVRDSHDE